MTTQQAVEAKIRELVPETTHKYLRHTCGKIPCTGCEKEEVVRELPIQLNHVLMAIRKGGGDWYSVDPSGAFLYLEDGVQFDEEVGWDLALPYDQQEPEIYDFLAEVLGVKE